MRSTTVLISGASIAGPSLAYWLRRYGFTPTVVERAPALREGGQAVDFRGHVHMALLRKMGLLDDVKRMRTRPGRWDIVDSEGRPIVSLPPEFAGGEVEILRGDLVRLLYDRTKDDAEYVFGDSIAAMTETPDGVEVAFDSGAVRTFDLVVGADGLHSGVRRLAFGPESRFVRPSGYHVALFNAPDHLGLGQGTLLYNEPGRALGVTAVPGGALNVMAVFHAEGLGYDRQDVSGQRRIVADAYAGAGWEVPRLLEHLPTAPDFYFDTIGLVRMDRFTQGRVALIGDAGYGATFGGMGAGMALVSSHVLAGELAAAGGDHRTGFAEYENLIRGFAKACQRIGANSGPFLAPPTRARIRRRNRLYRVMTSRLLAGVLDRLTTKAATSITLREYPG
ncbi:FAD-dependent monooxygenase [Microbispora corallina]|uniref:FAD-dependent oxidoreductase n=1 Tax=Microbispora corallina TaxID=83302 RepID=A0ABQ4G9L3_9ACTN|nr:FAD-dependent monooxygenase [Microbispora corallina]GIH43752.1 FAD-dependent oxidoreductase [Microbispora corallina]